jgi:NADH-quinone oxidoreductase subunit H
MDLNSILPGIYDAIANWLSGLLKGWGVAADISHAIVFLVMAIIVISVILIFIPVTFLVISWIERKWVARIQDRLGPNRVGPLGLLQPLADMVKMFTKEDIVPDNADKVVHLLAPIVLNVPVVLVFAVIPFGPGLVAVNLDNSLLYALAVSSMGTIAIFMAGWASNNKFSLIGGMRAVAQIVSYEVPQVLAVLVIVLLAGSINFTNIVQAQGGWFGFGWFLFRGFPIAPIAFIIYFIAAIAEVNRIPFDLPEAESELTAGHHTEYSGMRFGLFYLAEFMNAFLVAAIGATLFLGGWQGPILPGFVWFLLKTMLLVLVMFHLRGTLPRLRVDQLMGLAWKQLIPWTLGLVMATALLLPIFYKTIWFSLFTFGASK